MMGACGGHAVHHEPKQCAPCPIATSCRPLPRVGGRLPVGGLNDARSATVLRCLPGSARWTTRPGARCCLPGCRSAPCRWWRCPGCPQPSPGSWRAGWRWTCDACPMRSSATASARWRPASCSMPCASGRARLAGPVRLGLGRAVTLGRIPARHRQLATGRLRVPGRLSAPAAYAARLPCARPGRRRRRPRKAQLKAWSEETTGRLQLRLFEGDHRFIRDRQADVLAYLVRQLDGLAGRWPGAEAV